MKKLFKFILPILMAIIAIPAIQAKDKKSGRPSREQFAEVQAKKIAEDLKLDENTTKQFVATFTQCQKEIWSSAPQKIRKDKDQKASMTEAEATQIIKDRFAHRQKINEIQEKYYNEYSKFLTQRQILRVYNLEKKMMDKMFRQHMDGRRGNGQKHGKHRGTPQCNATAPGACTPCN